MSGKKRNLGIYGVRGRTARAFVEGDLARVQWRVDGMLKTKSFPNTTAGRSDARDFAQGVAEQLEQKRQPQALATVADLWSRYSGHEFPNLRVRTQVLNADAWRKFETLVGREKVAEDLGADSLALLRAELERLGLAVNTIARVVRGIKTVYNWGEVHGVLSRNKMHLYRFKVGKDRRPVKVPEYRREDFDALCAALPLAGRTWRAGGILRVCGYQGVRQGAVRHLRWEDVDWPGASIHWRARWDKLGRAWSQPLRAGTRQALEMLALKSNGSPWVFPKPRGGSDSQVYSAQALWWMLMQAEQRAGITHKVGRGMHGLRRMLAGDVMALTGNLKLAADAIGDRDLRVLQDHYLSTRDDEVRKAFDRLDDPNRNPNGNSGQMGDF